MIGNHLMKSFCGARLYNPGFVNSVGAPFKFERKKFKIEDA
jgi:hypothetical protein